VLLIVWIAVALLVLLVLGVLGYSVLGAAGRLGRELRGLQRDVQPLLAEAQAAAAQARGPLRDH
jgi:hypothetical protein